MTSGAPTDADVPNAVGTPERVETWTVRKLDFQRFAITVGDHNPLYFDTAAARAAGYRDIIAPPTFLSAILGWGAGPKEAELQTDGIDPALLPEPMRGRRIMGGGQQIQFGVAVYDADVVNLEFRVRKTYERASKFGALLFVEREIMARNQHNAHVMTCVETFIGAAAAP